MKKILSFIFGPVVGAVAEIFKEKKGLEDKWELKATLLDFLHIARNAGFVLIPSLLSGFIFLFLSQGRDTLLLVIEKMDSGDYRQLLFFLLAILIWSVFSELSIRYAIAISDNSGKSLRDSRIFSRKVSQRVLASFGLFWPSIMIIISLFYCYNSASYMSRSVKLLNFGVFILSLFIIMRALSYLYYHRRKRIGNAPARTILGARSLPKNEYDWVNRLYGIYNEFVYSLLKPTNFLGQYKKDMTSFTNHIVKSNKIFRAEFPQNQEAMAGLRILPKEFILLNTEDVVTDRGDSYKWRYRIPNSFYASFHTQVRWMALIAMVLMLSISIAPAGNSFFGILGAPALIGLAFASYCGLYCGILFIDYGVLRKNFFQLRWLLLTLLILSSIFNRDHPVDMKMKDNSPRNTIAEQFSAWLSDYSRRMKQTYPAIKKYPVVFVCAEGGALRTGAYTSLFLTKLQQDFNRQGIDFKKSIFSMSGVSGGALGLAYYNAKAFGGEPLNPRNGANLEDAIRFYQYDCLSPIVGKMLFGDFLNLFIPWHIKNFDRAIALERSWMDAYQATLHEGEKNLFSEPFIDGKKDLLKPVLIINTTEIESGYQCWVSNSRPSGIFYQQKRDLLQEKVKEISYSTAVNFSTRFPLFSPGAEIDTTGGRFHYLDGGYVENTGAASTVELLNILKEEVKDFDKVIPIVIYLRFSENTNTQAKNIKYANELVEIVSGIYNTRVGRSFTAIAQLNRFVHANNGIIIDEPLSRNDRDVPMNWVLSNQSTSNILEDITKKLNDTSQNGIKVKMLTKGAKYLRL